MPEVVECIVKGDSDKYADCRCVTRIETNEETYTRLEAHNAVKDGALIWVEGPETRVKLIDAEREGTKYVRTEPNDTTDDNLLKQPHC